MFLCLAVEYSKWLGGGLCYSMTTIYIAPVATVLHNHIEHNQTCLKNKSRNMKCKYITQFAWTLDYGHWNAVLWPSMAVNVVFGAGCHSDAGWRQRGWSELGSGSGSLSAQSANSPHLPHPPGMVV